MLFIPILLALDATVGGTLMMGAEPIGANVTVYNSGVSMATSAGADGKYSLSMLPAGTYDIKLERAMNGRKKNPDLQGAYRGRRFAHGRSLLAVG